MYYLANQLQKYIYLKIFMYIYRGTFCENKSLTITFYFPQLVLLKLFAVTHFPKCKINLKKLILLRY